LHPVPEVKRRYLAPSAADVVVDGEAEATEPLRAIKFGVKASATRGANDTANNAVNATDDGFMVGFRWRVDWVACNLGDVA